MHAENGNGFNTDAMTSRIIEQNKINCPSCAEDLMTNPNGEQKKNKCPSCGQDIMSVPKTNQGNANYINEDAMDSPIVEQNKIKYHEDVMTKSESDEKKNQSFTGEQDIMAIPKTNQSETKKVY